MAQLVITQNQEIKFEDYLKICLLQELYIKKQIATHFNTLPEGLYELQVQEAKLDTIPNELGLTVTYIDRFTNGILEVRINPGYKNEGELKAIDMVLKALQQSMGYGKNMKGLMLGFIALIQLLLFLFGLMMSFKRIVRQ